MQTRNPWVRHLRFKLFAVLCIMLLGQGLFIRPVQALPAGDANLYMSTVSWGPGRLDIFKIGDDRSIWIKSYENQWYPWSSLGNPGSSFESVSAVAWGPNRLDVFGVTRTSINPAVYTVWHKAWDGWGWWDWEDIGSGAGNLAEGVQAVSWGPGHLEIFTRSTTNSLGSGPLLHKWWMGGWGPSQTGWDTLDSSTAPATFFAVSHAPNRMDVFRTLVSNQSVARRYFDGASWKPIAAGWRGGPTWQGMNGGLSVNTPYAVSWDTNRIDVFVRGTDGAIWLSSTSNGGSSWTGWSSLARGSSSGITSSPSAVAWGPNRLDVFHSGGNGDVFHRAWDGANWWSGWETLGGSFSIHGGIAYPPQAVSWGQNRIDLFVLNGDGKVYHKWTDGYGWGPSQTDWENLGEP